MSFNPENYNRIRLEFDQKRLRALKAAVDRKTQLEEKIPDIAEIDENLAETGSMIIDAVMNHPEDLEERLAAIQEKNTAYHKIRRATLVANGYPDDYLDVQYECPLCDDTGYVDGKMCSCLRKELILAGYESSGIGELLRTQSFDTFSLDYYSTNPKVFAAMNKVYRDVFDYSEAFHGTGSGNLAFFGGTGLGKTHLSSAVAKKVIESGYDVMYVTAIGMISDFEYRRFGSSDTPDISPTERYFDCDLLIIDDLGTEISNQFSVSTIYSVLNTRLNSKKPMILSTNLNTEEFRKRYWDRITSRVFGEFFIEQFIGVDIRAQKLRQTSSK